MNQALYKKLRRDYPRFVYENFEEIFPDTAGVGNINLDMCLRFTFKIYDRKNKEAFRFTPEWRIPIRKFYDCAEIDPELWNRLLFYAGMIELISYWKITASPIVEIPCVQKLSKGSIPDTRGLDFWKKTYFEGLGEYFYLNGINTDISEFMDIRLKNVGSTEIRKVCRIALNKEILLPIGGGKDSVVSLDILSNTKWKSKDDILPMIINPRGATISCCNVANYKEEDIAIMYRSLDPLMLQLNNMGYLNGHTPFSALLAFASLIMSALTGRKHIALSNENSANESTVQGGANHQYSKSFEFEKDFSDFVSEYISPDFNYFSFLRPMSELAIAKVFSSIEKYHAVFKSCNQGSKQDIWCGCCAKCLFAYIILSPFLVQPKVEEIFGCNMLKKAELIPVLEELCGESLVKPFECVGTVSEVNWALQQLKPILNSSEGEEYLLLKHYFTLEKSEQEQDANIWLCLAKEHRLSDDFKEALLTYLTEKNILEWS